MIARLAAVLILLAVAVLLTSVAYGEAKPQRDLPLVQARNFVQVPVAPPMFCPAPMPVCQGGKCPHQRGSVA